MRKISKKNLYELVLKADEDNVPPQYKKKKLDLPNTNPTSVSNFQCSELTSCYKSCSPDDEVVVSESVINWTAGEISLFQCLIESFQNYCFIAKIMISKSCLQVRKSLMCVRIENANDKHF